MRGFEAVFVSLKDCQILLDSSQEPSQPIIRIPGFEQQLPDYAFVRGVPGGTLQQVIVRLDILHAMKMLGIRVYNDGRAIERTVDKAMTSFLLHYHGVATPATWICESRQQAHEVIAEQINAGHQLVIKPLFGSQGKGVRKLVAGDSLPVPMDEHVDGLYYLQRYIDSGEGRWHDHRVFIINGKAIGAMVRRGSSWVNNMAMGARSEAIANATELNELNTLAESAARAVDIDYCGVDIIRDRDGKLYVLEVNSIPAWRGLQSVVELDIAQVLVDHLLNVDQSNNVIPLYASA
ncbi:lysine biosynthesis protein LysX [Methyloradius palustris]|uniref:Lysine biosynthesis protein LysX n=1 Tax=Methyloradius palustris TaxID=2778876 RepID=A0A8D5JQY0_9PROT|nr:lysine biosynthesis protein LysX [Methyloradius palustris]